MTLSGAKRQGWSSLVTPNLSNNGMIGLLLARSRTANSHRHHTQARSVGGSAPGNRNVVPTTFVPCPQDTANLCGRCCQQRAQLKRRVSKRRVIKRRDGIERYAQIVVLVCQGVSIPSYVSHHGRKYIWTMKEEREFLL